MKLSTKKIILVLGGAVLGAIYGAFIADQLTQPMRLIAYGILLALYAAIVSKIISSAKR